MEAPKSGRSRSRRGDQEDGSRGVDDEEEWGGGSDRMKDKSGKSRRHLDQEEAEEQLESGRGRGSGDKSKRRKRLGGTSNRADSGEDDDYDVRRESQSKLLKRSSDERGGERRFSEYRDVERDSGGRKNRGDEMERDSDKKTGTRGSGYEGDSQVRSRGRIERGSHDADYDKSTEKDSRYSDRKEGSREKGHVSREQDRSIPRRRWDEGDPGGGRKIEEGSHGERLDSRSGKVSEHSKLVSSRDRVADVRNDSSEVKYKIADANAGKATRSGARDDKRVDGERSKGRERMENQDEDQRHVAASRENRLDGFRGDRQRRDYEKSTDDLDASAHRSSSRVFNEKGDKHKQPRELGHGARDDVDLHERSAKLDEDGHSRVRDRNGREARPNRRSRSPEKRHFKEHDEPDRVCSESDNERGMVPKSKEREKDAYRDERSAPKVKDTGWMDRSRDREPPKDQWKRNHAARQDRDLRDGDAEYEYDKEWDSKRREQEWVDGDKFHGRPAYRKDNRSRHDGMRSSSNFGNAHEHSDSIEIRPNKSLDFGKEESMQTYPGRTMESGSQQEAPAGNDEEWRYHGEDKSKMAHGFGDDNHEKYPDDSSPASRSFPDARDKGSGQKAQVNYNSAGSGQGMQPSYGGNQGAGFNNRPTQQGAKIGRHVRGGRGRLNGRDTQRVGLPLPVMGPPFAHLGMPPGPLQPMGPNLSPSPGPPLGPNVFMPPFPGLVWQGARVDMNVLGVPPALSPIPPGPLGPRFPPNMPPGPNHGMYFNQPGPGRGAPLSMPGPGFNQAGPVGRGAQNEKPSSGWAPNRSSGPPGKAPSRGEQNDYSQNFVDTGMRPQNFIRELELTSTVEDYPKLRELIQKKDEIVAKSASPPMYYKCDLREHVLSSEFYGTKFDVILVDPPWEEYVHRAPGVADHMEYWSFEEILNLRIEAIADTPSFIFLWVGDGVGLEQGRQCLKKWGFRRCEDICWVKTNKSNATPSLRHDSHTLFQHSKEHCLMGIKGTVRRSTDGHIIHANIDTDIIIAEEPPYGSTKKPDDIYRIIEHFSLGRRRLELFGEDHNIRSGWLTVGKGLSSSNFNTEVYCRNFADKDGKVWLGGGGRNPPPEAPHLVLTTPDIESLRPKSPPQKNQQQQQSTSISATANSKRQAGNSPQSHPAPPGLAASQEASSSNPLVPWASSPMIGSGFKGMEAGGSGGPDEKFFDGYVYNAMHRQVSGDRIEFEPHQTVNMM